MNHAVAVEFKPVKPWNPLAPSIETPDQAIWFRAVAPLGDDPLLHRAMLAYASDFNLIGTATRPHGESWYSPRLLMASLDHALWFHRDFRMDDWLLYAMDSPSAAGARGFTRGQIYTRDGTLVASVAQEGLIRPVPDRAL
jgi:acyl-CoA thioesterase-2